MISRSLAASMTVTLGGRLNVNEKRTKLKPLGLVASVAASTSKFEGPLRCVAQMGSLCGEL